MSKLSLTSTDWTGNQTAQPVAVIRDTTPPTVTFHLPDVAPLRFPVAWTGNDECGVRYYDVAYKQGTGGAWTGWLILRADLRTKPAPPRPRLCSWASPTKLTLSPGFARDRPHLGHG